MGPSEYMKFNALTARPHSSLGVFENFQKKTADQVSTAKIRPIRHRSLERMECLRCRSPLGFPNLQYSRSTTEKGSQTCNFQPYLLGSYTCFHIAHIYVRRSRQRSIALCLAGHNFDEATPGTEKILKSMDKYGESEKPEHAGR